MRNKKQLINRITNVLLLKGFQNAYIIEISQHEHLTRLILQLPEHKTIEDAKDLLPNIQQELNATNHKIEQEHGKLISVLFTTNKMTQVIYNDSMLNHDSLRITLQSHYERVYLDFADGASTHLLNGGTTRMGKTAFLLYVATCLYLQTKGDIDLFIASTKAKDFYPFMNVKHTSLVRTNTELEQMLDHLIIEYKIRDGLLYSPEYEKATDAKSVQKHYPDRYKHFKPIFLIIDEYARFADNKPIQKKVMELVESAGYVNIHIIISSQRPDAKTVLTPRIKANLLARICFTTADENNSLVILDTEGAEKLGRIQGRALFLDGSLTEVQVPYLDPETAYNLLTEYRKEEQHEPTNENKKEEPRPINPRLANKIQNLIAQSDCNIDL